MPSERVLNAASDLLDYKNEEGRPSRGSRNFGPKRTSRLQHLASEATKKRAAVRTLRLAPSESRVKRGDTHPKEIDGERTRTFNASMTPRAISEQNELVALRGQPQDVIDRKLEEMTDREPEGGRRRKSRRKRTSRRSKSRRRS